MQRVTERGTAWASAATDVAGGPGRAGGAAAVMAGEGLAAIRQGPDPAGADGFAAAVAIDHPCAVAAMRADAAGPVEFAGIVGLLRRLAAEHSAATGRAFVARRFGPFDPGDLKPVRRAHPLEQNSERFAVDGAAAGNHPRFRLAGGLTEGGHRIGERFLPRFDCR